MKVLVASLAVLAGSASAARQSAPGHRTLFPAHPPGHDANDFAHLVPGLQQNMHFREDGKTGSVYLLATYQKIQETLTDPF